MSKVLDFSEQHSELFRQVLKEKDPDLLKSLEDCDDPTIDQRIRVESVLSDEYIESLNEDDEPNAIGNELYRLIVAFLTRWPIELE